MDDVKQLIGEGVQLFKDSKLDEAIAKLKAAIEEDPSSVQAHSYLGAAYARNGENPASVEQFQAAVDLDPQSAVNTFNLGQAYQTAGSKPRAQALYEKALALDPKYARAKQRLDALAGVPAPKPEATPAPTPPPAQTQAMPSAPPPGVTQMPAAAAPLAGPPQYTGPSPYGPPPQAGVAPGYAAAATPGPPTATSEKISKLEARVRSGGRWFYWIAGLSLANTVIALVNGGIGGFALGLGVTFILDNVMCGAKEFNIPANLALLCIPVNLVIAGIYAALGYFACKTTRWAFIVGLVLYSLDTLLIVLSLLGGSMLFISALIHVVALVAIAGGIGASGQLVQIRRQMEAYARPNQGQSPVGPRV